MDSGAEPHLLPWGGRNRKSLSSALSQAISVQDPSSSPGPAQRPNANVHYWVLARKQIPKSLLLVRSWWNLKVGRITRGSCRSHMLLHLETSESPTWWSTELTAALWGKKIISCLFHLLFKSTLMSSQNISDSISQILGKWFIRLKWQWAELVIVVKIMYVCQYPYSSFRVSDLSMRTVT